MKKLVAGFVFALLALQVTPASAATGTVRITDTQHRQFDGTFRNSELLAEISTGGRLSNLLSQRAGTWVIDPAVVDEVNALTAPYTLNNGKKFDASLEAIAWIAKLKSVTRYAKVVALPYGNPDPIVTRSVAPTELRFYYEYGQRQLSTILNKSVERGEGWSQGKVKVGNFTRSIYRDSRRALTELSTVVNPTEIEPQRAQLGRLLSATLSQRDRAFFTYNAEEVVEKTKDRLRVFAGKFQLTSAKVKLPLTLGNDFDSPVTVKLLLNPFSTRVLIEDVPEITLEPRSKTQISVPLEIVAPGETLVEAQFVNKAGDPIGDPAILELNLTVIDSRVTWFTTGAAILLFLGAVTQSVRRVRRARK